MPEMLRHYLGIPPHEEEFLERKLKKALVGVCNVLSVSGYVGHVLTVECVFDTTHPDKKGLMHFSGNLKKVLQESITVAKINAYKYFN